MKTSPKKRIHIVIAWAFFATSTSLSWAVTYGVKQTKHNLGTTQDGSGSQFESSNETEICKFCHVPHNANTSDGKKFLWNRPDPGHTFTIYTASPSLNYNKAGIQISPISKMCMSCHDGVTALNTLYNPSNINMQNHGVGEQAFMQMGSLPYPATIGAESWSNVGSGGNLANDHPISFSYQSAIDNGDNSLRPVAQLDLPLWDGKVECVSCHDPHINYNPLKGGDASLAPFLRKSNVSSALCFTCHDK